MKKGLLKLITGIVILLSGFVFGPMLLIVPLFFIDSNEIEFRAPGKATIEIQKPARYHLWSNFKTVWEGEAFNKPSSLPDGMKFTVEREDGSSELFVSEYHVSQTDDGPNQAHIGYVDLKVAGRYTVAAIGGDDERVLSFEESQGLSALKGFATVLVLGLFLGALGIYLIIRGIIELNKNSNSNQSLQTTESAAQPPPLS